MTCPREAHAYPFRQRLSARGEATLGYVLGEPQNQLYSAGALVSLRLACVLYEPLTLQLSVTQGVFPSSVVPNSLNTNYMAGLRVEPRTVRPEGRLFVDVNAGLAISGYNYRFGFDAGFGWEFAVSRYFYMGPVFRYSHIVQPDVEDTMDDSDAHYVSLGLSIMLRPFPPPRIRQGTFVAINLANAPDGDYDGVPDFQDRCPDVVEDHDGFEDEDGCPDLDDDNDRMPDSEDRCPRAAESLNGFEDEDGCPDELPASREPIELEGDSLRLRQRVYFAVDRTQIPTFMFQTLTDLARFLNAHAEIRKMRIEGNADDRGTRRHGFELSLRRAQTIMAFLVERGVEASRLEAVGLGDLRPIEVAHDEIARSRNRRIEFIVVEGIAAQAVPPPVPPEAWTRLPDTIDTSTTAHPDAPLPPPLPLPTPEPPPEPTPPPASAPAPSPPANAPRS
jgi:outer membrane protein OmpA-like peptidoglycan-associated protein